MDMTGRTVVITGAAGHLGQAMCVALAELGANLFLVDKPGTNFNELSVDLKDLQGRVEYFESDLESENSRQELLKNIQNSGNTIDCLINNAAFVGDSEINGWAVPFENQNLDSWRRAVEVNLTAAFHLSQGLAPMLKKSGGGSIINITSIYGNVGPDWRLYMDTSMGNPAAYSASKGALEQLTRWLSTTLAPKIRVNAIAPGGISRGQPSSFVKKYEDRTPLQRMATEEDFIGAVAFLASDLSSYITGQIIKVDGGWSVW